MSENTSPKGDSELGASAVGNEPIVLLPRFIVRRADGLYVDVSMVESTANFAQFADRVFGSDAYFADLNYPLFQKLLFEPESPELMLHVDSGGSHPRLRLARDIVPFKNERRQIYHAIKVSRNGTTAEYFFAPVAIDQVKIEPVFGPLQDDGSQEVLRYDSKTISVPTQLDADEFVAAMWLQGIRFGLDMAGVREVLSKGVSERRVIAQEKKPESGVDATIQEQTDTLHRDDAPKILSNGRIDLRRFKNHFPQVEAGVRLLKKMPRQLGQPGFNVQGRLFEPEIPKDFDIETVCGPGTRVEHGEDGDFVVAAITGFVNVDIESNLISVTEKIVNRHGISIRTTGDLTLSGADFEEHGEVQERRQVQGHNMTFLADVFGEITSDGGCVRLHEALAGGAVRSPGGSILVEKTASRATIDARGGSVEVGSAESCVILGNSVRIGRAINCDIVGEDVSIENCEGCAIAGRKIEIRQTGNRKDIETVITVLLPENSNWERELDELARKSEALAKAIEVNLGTSAQISLQPEVRKFLTIQKGIRAGEIVISGNQEAAWRAAQAKFAGVMRQLEKLANDLTALQKEASDAAAKSEAIKTARSQAFAAISCQFDHAVGQTIVRTQRAPAFGFPFEALNAKELHQALRQHGTATERLFSGDSGNFLWCGSSLQEATKP